ncbi:hypothetical protein PVAP13_8KG066100 [Panicum virgatum]|uniref:DUF1618 domain-containing protein n=1 Tax=Panicum virgatum TaxID=38727 RepID=A0A8T0PQW8_PANVG|nr:hypothetical protein PVAP13_8KG066100 [Panicum virgatum]
MELSEAPQPQPPSDSPAAAASYPPWVLLECRCSAAGDEDEGGDAWTAAACRTSAGEPIRASVRVAAPPAESQVCLQVKDRSYAVVVAAHGDSVLIAVGFNQYERQPEYFVYSAGAGTTKPPSLRLLPPTSAHSNIEATGLIMRPGREDDDLVVASLDLRPVMVGGRDGEVLQQQMVAGGGLLCWVRRHGLIFCNVLDEAPVLRHVPFAPVEEEEGDHALLCRGSTHDACIAADGTVRLVAVHPRCCYGGSGATHCRRSSNAYTIRTWTLRTDTMAWAMDGVLDATELWALDAAKALPRAQPAYPIIVSEDEPHLVFFINAGDGTEWMILVDTRSKTIRSVRRYDRGYYFNSSPRCSDVAAAASSVTKSRSSVVTVNEEQRLGEDDGRNLKAPAASAEETTILAVLQEIPGLAREDMLKAYSILSHDINGRRFRSLLGLPVDLRKDWLLMEIKSSEACSVCSACTANLRRG